MNIPKHGSQGLFDWQPCQEDLSLGTIYHLGLGLCSEVCLFVCCFWLSFPAQLLILPRLWASLLRGHNHFVLPSFDLRGLASHHISRFVSDPTFHPGPTLCIQLVLPQGLPGAVGNLLTSGPSEKGQDQVNPCTWPRS